MSKLVLATIIALLSSDRQKPLHYYNGCLINEAKFDPRLALLLILGL